MEKGSFVMFGHQHLYAIFTAIFFTIILSAVVKKYASSKTEAVVRITLALVIWIQESSVWIYRICNNMFIVHENLPLHLCGFSALLLPILLFTKNKKLYDVLYFWGIGGATQALLTPTLEFSFPHFLFIQFFTAHGLIVTAVIYATVVFNYQPDFRALLRTFLITISLLIPIGFINWILGSNYFFIARKPDSASLLDFMGPWPFYLIPLALVAFIIFFIIYIPFPIINRLRR
ncbi:MAG: TIGR02206 family membrane protein [Candidatus Marinimicrobia bacterium]|nr:TIGR02206 family membrane protein [Candidatus Neomarinimicrobiota bacterium]